MTGVSSYPVVATGKSGENYIANDTSFQQENKKSNQDTFIRHLSKTMDGYTLHNLTFPVDSNIKTSTKYNNNSLQEMDKSEHFRVIALGLSQFSNHVVTPDSDADEDLSPFQGKYIVLLTVFQLKTDNSCCPRIVSPYIKDGDSYNESVHCFHVSTNYITRRRNCSSSNCTQVKAIA